MYHVDKVIRETGDVIDDGVHTVFVNTKVNDGTDVAELMEIFKSSSVKENDKFPNVCKAVKNYKEGKGRDKMCAVVEEYADKQVLETVKSFIAAGASNELIKKATNLTDDEIDKLRSELS